ncbi:right-handed parallel beta-helix repeat-containing protein [Prevotella pectinovora]|jgi:cell wall/surface repeat protein|uniref:right-handed parallel beta-helix repeat-containing protein n=1 Tax=Prevotella pectinovora TaxID=1602169 RepID=UPI0025981359|nr:right-handed parallel beta-helix repeat-containing protein [uncultured Prevotella sp.]
MKQLWALVATVMSCATLSAQDVESDNRSWSFTSVSQADVSLISGDANWKKDSKSRYCYVLAMDNAPVKANDTELDVAKGLTFTITANDNGNLRLGGSTGALWLGDASSLVIPNRKAGEMVKIEYCTSNKSSTRSLALVNLEGTFPASTGKEHQQGSGKIVADGDVVVGITGGMYIYSLAVGDEETIGGGGGTSPDNPDNPNDQTPGLDYMTGDAPIATAKLGSGPKIYVSPTGSDANDGLTPETALASIQLAIDKAVDPGTTICLAAGEYRPTARININDRNGTADNYNSLVCLDGRAVINCDHPYHSHSDNPYQGIRLTSSYWHFYHVDVTNASDNGLLIERNKPTGGSSTDIQNRTQDAHDNIIEDCKFYRNGDTGVQIKNLGAYNYILNCDAFENKDEGDGDADGFAPKISVGTGNYFYGCRAYNNSDDGYDVFFKKSGGFKDNVTIVFENCLAYENAIINGALTQGNGNGFKCGSDQGAMNVVLNRCIAVNNVNKGFDQNHNSGDIIMNNCTGYALKSVDGLTLKKSYSYRAYEDIAAGHELVATNCISINDNLKTDTHHEDPTKLGEKSTKYGRTQISVGTLVTTDLSVDPSNVVNEDNYAELIADRDVNGDLQWDNITWAHPVEGNALLVDKGTVVDENTKYASQNVRIPAIRYAGAAPDLGAFELGLKSKSVAFGSATNGIGYIQNSESNGKKVRLVQAFNGQVIVSVDGAQAKDKFVISAYDADGMLLGKHDFNGTNTSIYLPKSNGMIILKVNGKNLKESLKVVVK